jgi:ADP-ribose pyrophosphatase
VTEATSGEREIYAGRVVTLRLKDLLQADGSVRLREIVEHAPGAAVVAVDAHGSILLVRQWRPAVSHAVLELPAGLVDPGESPLDCARRELEEETGFTADEIAPLATFYSSPGFCTEVLHIFVASSLRPSHSVHDEEEELELVHMPLDAAIDQVLTHEISDAKTVTGLLAYYRMSSGRSSMTR